MTLHSHFYFYLAVGVGSCFAYTTMHPEKKQILLNNNSAASDNDFVASFDDLGVDELADILEFLTLKDIMRSRRINKKLMEAVKKTIVPLTDFRADNVKNYQFFVETLESYNAMRVMTRAMPNLQQLWISDLGTGLMIQPDEWGHNWSDGEDPNQERAAVTADTNRYDIDIISNFSKLRILRISCRKLNGRFPFLFNSFPLLQKLSIKWCHYLKWDLEMLAGFPLLKELECYEGLGMTGNINSLRVLKDTLEKVVMKGGNQKHISIFLPYPQESPKVQGNLMDLADFPHLKVLDLEDTAVTGDIRDIRENDFTSLEQLKLPKGVTGDIRDIGESDFPSLECLELPKTVYGAAGYEFQRISDAPDLVRAVYLLKKQRPALKMKSWYGKLSEDSPDWYNTAADDECYFPPPFYIHFIEAGSRIGYRWTISEWEDKYGQNSCEVNWLDPEPDRDSSDYEKYIYDLQGIESEVYTYRGFHQPPTQEEYTILFEKYREGFIPG